MLVGEEGSVSQDFPQEILCGKGGRPGLDVTP